MGTKPTKQKYKPLFDPASFNLDNKIEAYRYIEHHFPIYNKKEQIERCSKYLTAIKLTNNLEGYMCEGAYILAMIQEIKTEEEVRDNKTELEYYNKLYKEIYDLLKSLNG